MGHSIFISITCRCSLWCEKMENIEYNYDSCLKNQLVKTYFICCMCKTFVSKNEWVKRPIMNDISYTRIMFMVICLGTRPWSMMNCMEIVKCQQCICLWCVFEIWSILPLYMVYDRGHAVIIFICDNIWGRGYEVRPRSREGRLSCNEVNHEITTLRQEVTRRGQEVTSHRDPAISWPCSISTIRNPLHMRMQWRGHEVERSWSHKVAK